MQSVIIKSGMEQFLVLMEYLSNGCHVVVRANLLAGASLGFEQELQLNSATVSLTIKLWLLLCWGVSLDGHWQVFLATVNSCEHFLLWIPNLGDLWGDLWWIHVLCGEPEGKKGEKGKKKCLERSSSAESYFLSIELVVRRLELMWVESKPLAMSGSQAELLCGDILTY